MTKHTPAPWKVTNLKNCHTPGYAHLVGGDGINTHVALTVREDDARLIAAAPELLDALKAIEGMCNMPEVRQAMMKHEQAYYHKTMNAARAAIQKAE